MSCHLLLFFFFTFLFLIVVKSLHSMTVLVEVTLYCLLIHDIDIYDFLKFGKRHTCSFRDALLLS